ncbi:MAG: hypothetical protein QXG98_02935 [Candidatus Micrarchaeia archaeon]
MRVEALLNLRDAPGTLLEALRPISAHGGNILSITHFREKMEAEFVPTLITFEVRDLEQLEAIKKGMEAARLRIRELKLEGRRITKRKTFSVVLIGHIMRTDAKDTIDQLNASGAWVTSFNVSIIAPELYSSAIMRIVVEESKYQAVLRTLERVAEKKGLLVINELL